MTTQDSADSTQSQPTPQLSDDRVARPFAVHMSIPSAGMNVRRTRRWTECELHEEKEKLEAWLDARAAKGLRVPSSRARPEMPFTAVIAREAKVRRAAISLENGHLRETLAKYVRSLGLEPYDGPVGVHYDRSDRIHGDLVTYIESGKTSGLGLPSTNGRPNMAAIARGAQIGDSTLTDKTHRNHRLVVESFAVMGGATEHPKRSGVLVLAELLKALAAPA